MEYSMGYIDLLALAEKSPTIRYKGGVHPVFHLQGSLELAKKYIRKANHKTCS